MSVQRVFLHDERTREGHVMKDLPCLLRTKSGGSDSAQAVCVCVSLGGGVCVSVCVRGGRPHLESTMAMDAVGVGGVERTYVL